MSISEMSLSVLLCALFIGQVMPATDMIDDLDNFVAKTMAGVELTLGYTLSFGTDYPPIEQDVTLWCVAAGTGNQELTQIFRNDPEIKSKINFELPVNFVIHGWLGGLNGGNMYLPSNMMPKEQGWMRSTAFNWAEASRCNVCAIDWSRLSNYDYSIAALKHTKKVADFLVDFFNFLIDNGMDVSETAIAGHSLGAQVAGFVGAQFRGILYAIYGMDPAGPGFTAPFDLGEGTRLDKSDAQYVQCIHTSRGTLGTLKSCGHQDFIVNGGFVQPGCISLMCSHSKAHDYFNEASLSGNNFIGTRCSSSFKRLVKSMIGQTCSNDYDVLGIHSARAIAGKFYLKTNTESPFALNQVS